MILMHAESDGVVECVLNLGRKVEAFSLHVGGSCCRHHPHGGSMGGCMEEGNFLCKSVASVRYASRPASGLSQTA